VTCTSGSPVSSATPAPIAGPAGGDEHADRFGAQAPRREPQDLSGCPVQPLRVIDRQQQWAFLRHVGKQPQHRQADHEPVRGAADQGAACVEPEAGPQRAPLCRGKTSRVLEHRLADLLQRGEGRLLLRFHAGTADDPVVGGLPEHALQRRRLADAGFRPQDQRPAAPAPHVGK
jgi:hypothetical protein